MYTYRVSAGPAAVGWFRRRWRLGLCKVDQVLEKGVLGFSLAGCCRPWCTLLILTAPWVQGEVFSLCQQSIVATSVAPTRVHVLLKVLLSLAIPRRRWRQGTCSSSLWFPWSFWKIFTRLLSSRRWRETRKSSWVYEVVIR